MWLAGVGAGFALFDRIERDYQPDPRNLRNDPPLLLAFCLPLGFKVLKKFGKKF
jgi:hypothetical protein